MQMQIMNANTNENHLVCKIKRLQIMSVINGKANANAKANAIHDCRRICKFQHESKCGNFYFKIFVRF